MCFAQIHLLVALLQTHVNNLGQKLCSDTQGVCVHSFEAIMPTLPDISCSQTEGQADTQTDTRTDRRTDRGEYIVPAMPFGLVQTKKVYQLIEDDRVEPK